MAKHKKSFIALKPENFRWIIVSLSLAILPHVKHLPIWLTLFAACIILFKLLTNRKVGILHSLPLTLFSVAAIIAEYGKLFGRDAGVSLLVIMLTLKLLETKSRRDGIVIIGMTYFLVITNFFYAQSIPTAIYMLIIVLVTTASLIALNQNSQEPRAIDKLKISGKLLVQALPLMIILFFLFPRLPGPLWGLPADAHSGKSGLSDKMSPGNISNLVLSNEVAFRVKFQDKPPSANELYWRAIILYDYDSVTWSHVDSTGKHNSASPFKPLSQATEYTVTVEPHNLKWLFALDLPLPDTNINNTNPVTAEYTLQSKVPLSKLKQYTITSHTQYAFDRSTLSPEIRNKALQLPSNSNPKTISFAKQLSLSGLSKSEIIKQVLATYHQENFIYSLKPPIYGRHSVDEFLFEKRKGFCEHYASSFAFLMRAAGIPARIVLGYQGGEVNPLDDYMIIRQADAHAWVEVWTDENGWKRADPTAMVSPSRIENGLDSAIRGDENPRFLFQRKHSIFFKASLLWDAMNYRWNQWVLNYNSEKQKTFMSYFGIKDVKIHQLIFILTIVFMLCLIIIAFVLFRTSKKRNPDEVQALYLKFCAKLSKTGSIKLPHEGPLDYCKRLKTANIIHYDQIRMITQLYIELRYTAEATRQKRYQFKKKVNDLKIT